MNWFEILANIVGAVLVTQFFVRYFGIRENFHKPFVIAVMVLEYFGVMTLCNFLDYVSTYQPYLTNCLWLFLIFALLDGGFPEKLLMTLISTLISLSTSMLLLSLFSHTIEYDMNGYPLLGPARILLCILAMGIYFILTEYIIRNRIQEKSFVPNKVYYKLIAIMAVTIFSFTFILSSFFTTSFTTPISSMSLWIALSLIIIDITIYSLYIELAQNSIHLVKEQLKNAAYENERSNLKTIQEIYQNTISIRHDLKNILLAILAKLENKQTEDACRYIRNELNIHLAKLCIISTDSAVIDAVLNRSAQSAKENNIDFQCTLLCSMKLIDEFDMALILSNLLDNALEAAKKTSSATPFINLIIRAMDCHLVIEISNSYNGELRKDGNFLRTTKTDASSHGYGVINVKKITAKYNGVYQYATNENEFHTSIVLNILNKCSN